MFLVSVGEEQTFLCIHISTTPYGMDLVDIKRIKVKVVEDDGNRLIIR
jgi:hypothetical protein